MSTRDIEAARATRAKWKAEGRQAFVSQEQHKGSTTMSGNLVTVCVYPGCAVLVLRGRCKQHAYPAWGGPRSYGSTWATIRKRVRAEEPHCRYCGSPTAIVDHIIPKYLGGTDARGNLQGLCRACSTAKTARESAAARRRR